MMRQRGAIPSLGSHSEVEAYLPFPGGHGGRASLSRRLEV